MELASAVIRYLIMLCLNIVSINMFFYLLLGKAKYPGRFVGFLLGKGVLWGCFVELILSTFYGEELWYQIIKSIGVLILAISAYIVSYLCYYGSFMKVTIAGLIVEALSVFSSYCGMVLIAVLLKRDMNDLFFGQLNIGDLLLCIWYIFWLPFMRFCFGKVFKKYREIELKHPKIWLGLFVTYYIFMFYNTLNSSMQTLQHTYRFAFNITCTIGIPGIFFLLFMVFWRKKSLRSEKEYLDVQKRLMQEHMELLVEQESIVRHRQKETEEQMKRLEYLQDESKEREEIKQYLHELKEQYKDLTVYQYCDDMALNAILNYRLKEILEQNVDVHVSIATEATDELRKQMWTVLGEVADEVQRVETKELEIKVFEAKGQCWIQYTLDRQQKNKKIIRI